MAHRILRITGMSCGHCVAAVRKELSKIPGIRIDQVAIGSADVTIDPSVTGDDELRRAVGEAGYVLESIAGGEGQ